MVNEWSVAREPKMGSEIEQFLYRGRQQFSRCNEIQQIKNL